MGMFRHKQVRIAWVEIWDLPNTRICSKKGLMKIMLLKEILCGVAICQRLSVPISWQKYRDIDFRNY
ncbi:MULTISPECIES: hypothetical protein [unclassified Microcoleus]|uniref:hypothetical protein n=1 Tax=unclassified Microcoleus TaxID=2642155 RepID=UPI0025F7DAFF|nr:MULTISPECIES: hypothetical protein [unclassified Microcoleus]